MKVPFKQALGWVLKADPIVQVLVGSVGLGLLAAAIFIAAHVFTAPQRAAVARVEARAATANSKAAQTMAQVGESVVQEAAKRDQRTAEMQKDHAHALAQLPSAATAIPDADADAWRRGLCMYDSARGDPACARLR